MNVVMKILQIHDYQNQWHCLLSKKNTALRTWCMLFYFLVTCFDTSTTQQVFYIRKANRYAMYTKLCKVLLESSNDNSNKSRQALWNANKWWAIEVGETVRMIFAMTWHSMIELLIVNNLRLFGNSLAVGLTING